MPSNAGTAARNKFVRLEAELPISGSGVLFWRVAQEPATGLQVDNESIHISKTLPLLKNYFIGSGLLQAVGNSITLQCTTIAV